MTDEKKLLINLKNGKGGSLEKAIKLYTPYVCTVIYNIVGSGMPKEDVEEAVSDVFVSLWRHAGDLDAEKGSVRSYLGVIARNCAKNRMRSARTFEEYDETLADERGTEEIAEERERRRILISLIQKLGEPDSEIFMRYYFYDEKISKISAVTGICGSTIKTKLSRCRSKMKILLRESGINGELRDGRYGNEQTAS